MSEKLLESDFLTVNIASIINQNQQDKTEQPSALDAGKENEADNANLTKNDSFIAWGEELKNRLDNNKKSSPESRLTDYDIETKFFREFFSAKWDDDQCAKQLELIGEPLRKAIKVLGFNESINPILAFINLPYVKNKLIKTKLLNINTFKAIYNAVADKLIADSEFLAVRNYNIIYCTDLYKKSASEMEKYLKIQKDILHPNAKSYDAETIIKNRRVFLQQPGKVSDSGVMSKAGKKVGNVKQQKYAKTTDEDATLNSLATIQTIYHGITGDDLNLKKIVDNKTLRDIASKIKGAAQVFAVLQYLSMSTGNEKARQALNNNKFTNISARDLTSATKVVTSNISKLHFSKSDIDALVGLLLDNL